MGLIVNEVNKRDIKIIVKDKCIGFVEISESCDVINITEIHIISDYQGLGIGSRIIKDVIRRAKSKMKKVSLGCFKENKAAAKLYIRLGYHLIDETETHYCFEK